MHYLAPKLTPLLRKKKIALKQNPLYLRKWNFLNLKLKNFLYFLKKNLFLYFLKKSSPHFPPQKFSENSALKKFLIFLNKAPRLPNILEMDTSKKFLYFRKYNFLSNNFPRLKIIKLFIFFLIKKQKF